MVTHYPHIGNNENNQGLHYSAFPAVIHSPGVDLQGKNISPAIKSALNPRSRASARGAASSFDRLSVRELEIVRLIMDGRKIGAIAKTLHLSEKTIANNVSRIKKKLVAENTVELVRLALQAGIINPQPTDETVHE